MHLIQFLLPLYTAEGVKVRESAFAGVRRELTDRFGGVTAYSQSPASGLWKTGDGGAERDVLILVEVVVEALDREWWQEYKAALAQQFGQAEIHMRAIAVDVI